MTHTDLGLGRFAYEKGLHDLGGSAGSGAWAWLQPDGGWGWSNAGLITDSGQSLLVDTLFDLKHTAEMLDAMKASVPEAARIGTLVNSHANGDHTFGNELVEGAEIVASSAAAREMTEAPPERLAMLMQMARSQDDEVGRFLLDCFGAFEFSGITLAAPTRTFDRNLSLQVGAKTIELIEVGPAHTAGDTLIWVPEDRVLFSGDILFVEGTPILWAGPVQNWLDACDRILELEPELIVPGHGPITDLRGPRAMKAYFEYIRDEAKKRFDAGLDVVEATHDIALGDFSSWGDAERIAINVDSLYREFSGVTERTPITELFARMAAISRGRLRAAEAP